ncbi:MAG: hypothetical protein IJV38_06545 [Prevotella sp.]|nr:hypothetical protein [Prevotella sp.]
MTNRQTQMAIKILQYLSDNNNFERDGNVYTYICDGNTESRELEGDYEYVRESLEKDYRLIRRERAELHLTPDGEAAQRIGFEKYIGKVKKGVQLEVTLKQLDILSKVVTIIKDSKAVLMIVAAFLGGMVVGIAWLVGWSITPIIKRIATLLF